MKKKVLSIIAVILCLPLIVSFPISAIQPRAEMEISVWMVVHMGDDVKSTTLEGEPNAGHAFLVFENESTIPVTIGRMSVAPGEAISIGTFGNRSTHRGIWYNIEAYLQPENCYAMCYAGITSDYELSRVNAEINKRSNDTYETDRNSSALFAQTIYRVLNDYMFTLENVSPSALRNAMIGLGQDGYTLYENYTPPSRSRSSIAYQNGTSLVYYPNGAGAH